MRLLLAGCLATAVVGCADRKPSTPPPSNVATARPASAASPTEGRLAWAPDEATAFARARSEGKHVMVHFSATWCIPCLELEQSFEAPDVARSIAASFVPLKLDVSEVTDVAIDQKRRYGADILPAVVFVSTDGKVLGRLSEPVHKQGLLDIVTAAATKARSTPAQARTP